jgi:DNA helicase-2/ATP-dependent DNA helicase PcrA
VSQTLVLGGPGCGKTTELLRVIDTYLALGVSPSRIGYVTFTRKAAAEGLDRACSKFGLEPDDLPYFRTLHSLAFKQLGLQTASIVTNKLLTEFSNWAGLVLSKQADDPESGSSLPLITQDDRILNALSLARLTRRSVPETCERLLVSEYDARRVGQDYAYFKEQRAVLDFTDMIEQFSTGEHQVPHFEVLIVDEAQDLCRLQWEMVEKLAKNAEDIFIAGDDDQAIYQWAGADIEYFLALKGARNVLPVSYRLRSSVFAVCQSIVSRIDKRFAKNWKPHAEGGSVENIVGVEDVDLSKDSWYLLTRNAYLQSSYRGYLRDRGIPFFDGSRSTVDNDEVRAILYWEKLRKGGLLLSAEVQTLYQKLKTKAIEKGFSSHKFEAGEYHMGDLRSTFGLLSEEDWMHSLDLSPRDRNYYREIKFRGESLIKPPRVTLSTIHGVKGGEADNVLLVPDMSSATHDNFVRDRQAEARVFYVAASRAKEALYIMAPTSAKHYPLGIEA